MTIDQSLLSIILALRRFFAKRGKTKLVISDNFQTFKSTELNNFYETIALNGRSYFGKVTLLGRVLQKN